MTRGQRSEVGDEREAPNGYHYTKAISGWRLTHHLVMEKKLGRPLRQDERVVFLDGKRHNLSPDNLEVRLKGTASPRRRVAQIEARIADLQAELELVQKELNRG